MDSNHTSLQSTGETKKAENNDTKSIIYNAMVKRNPILVSGMVIAPAVVFANTYMRAVTLVITFSSITLFTLLFSSFVSQRILYTIRIIIYTIIGSLVYVPVAIVLNTFIPDSVTEMGVYFPLLITNSFIISCSETTFFAENKGKMLIDILFSILGYDIAVLIFGVVREIISTGELNGKIIAMPMQFSGFSEVYGGFILLGIFAALFRAINLIVRKIKQ